MKANISNLMNRKPTLCGIDDHTLFSVLVPLIEIDHQAHILFEIRSEKLIKQPNEICFPGGKIELHETPKEAAIRETSEELCLSPSHITILGELDTLVTPFNTVIYPFAGNLYHDTKTFSQDEVKEVFTVPLSFFMNNKPLITYLDVAMYPREDFPFQMVQGGRTYPWKSGSYPVYFYIYEDKIIWGITARILFNFIKILGAPDMLLP